MLKRLEYGPEINERIIQIAEKVVAAKSVDPQDLEFIQQNNLLSPSTSYRACVLYPRERTMLRFSTDDQKGAERFSGFLGFDDHQELTTIDLRFPKPQQLYQAISPDGLRTWFDITENLRSESMGLPY